MTPRISIILPAANEERLIARALRSLAAQRYSALEIIVIVNGSHDKTAKIARAAGARVIEFTRLLGYSRARNEGAKVAKGEIYVFMDADSYLGEGVLKHVARNTSPTCLGTVLGAPDTSQLVHRMFFFIKNSVHRLGLYKGVLGGMSFCHARLFENARFDPHVAVDENYEWSRRARACGGSYVLLTQCRAYTSMRRWEDGMWKLFFFWIKLRVRSLFKWHDVSEGRYVRTIFTAEKE